ncbi:hypothetical protein [Parasphaerochaeta coccoides]|uniref:hypothetical protein n=1 Tax=Parasphaerochaeta coccoides TaxID=273376 RepID=UPI0003139569|nr:hypothetical protein [Parasphaerochaeta coccoides]
MIPDNIIWVSVTMRKLPLKLLLEKDYTASYIVEWPQWDDAIANRNPEETRRW